jgi:signal transduction histidine kinase
MADAARGLKPFPAGAFLSIVILVCAGLAASAAYTFRMLAQMRSSYLLNQARQIATIIDAQARGRGVRRDPDEWQRVIDSNFQSFDGVEFIALQDRSGGLLAARSATDESVYPAPIGYSMRGTEHIYVADLPVSSPRGGPMGGVMSEIAGWHLRIGVSAAAADFIRRAAVLQVAMATVAIMLLTALSGYLLYTVRRFVELKEREQAERRLKALGTMSASLAHEIRNPLGAIKGLTQLVQEELPKDHGGQSMMSTVVAETERLERLVTELLAFARPRIPEWTDFDYSALLEEVKMIIQPGLAETGKPVEIITDGKPIQFRSDANGLRQVLLNVVLNALEVTPEGKTVTITSRLEDNSRVLVTEVEDAGPGIGTQNAEEFFEPFFTTRAKGTGLGLSISRQIVESLGGTIKLADAESGGARCTIRIPRAPER